MMRKVKLCMDSCEYRVKPTGAEIGRISSRIAKSDRVVTLCGIVDLLLLRTTKGQEQYGKLRQKRTLKIAENFKIG